MEEISAFDPWDYFSEDISNGEEVFYDSERTSYVFLDLVHYSIPRIADLQPVRSNIISALEQFGLHGVVLMLAFGDDEMKYLKNDLNDAGIRYFASGEPEREPDSELHRVLKCLESRHHDLFLVKPPDADGLFLSRSVVDCIQGLDGGKPIIRGMRMDYALGNVIEDFSKRITYVKGDKAGVFWDLVVGLLTRSMRKSNQHFVI